MAKLIGIGFYTPQVIFNDVSFSQRFLKPPNKPSWVGLDWVKSYDWVIEKSKILAFFDWIVISNPSSVIVDWVP